MCPSSKTPLVSSWPDGALEEDGVLGDDSDCRSQVRQPYLADVHLQILVQSIQWLNHFEFNTSSTIIEPEWSSTILSRVEIKEDLPAAVLPTMPTWVRSREGQDFHFRMRFTLVPPTTCTLMSCRTRGRSGRYRKLTEDIRIPPSAARIASLLYGTISLKILHFLLIHHKERKINYISLGWGDRPGQLEGGRRGRRCGASCAEFLFPWLPPLSPFFPWLPPTFPFFPWLPPLFPFLLPGASLCSQPASPKNWFALETPTSVSSRTEWKYKPTK